MHTPCHLIVVNINPHRFNPLLVMHRCLCKDCHDGTFTHKVKQYIRVIKLDMYPKGVRMTLKYFFKGITGLQPFRRKGHTIWHHIVETDILTGSKRVVCTYNSGQIVLKQYM